MRRSSPTESTTRPRPKSTLYRRWKPACVKALALGLWVLSAGGAFVWAGDPASEDDAPAPPAQGRSSQLAITGVVLHAGDGRVIEGGVILIEGGRIAAAGTASEVAIPQEAERIDGEGLHATPGLIDLHARLFIEPGEERDLGNTGSRQAGDALRPFDPAARTAFAAGVTAVAVAPGTSRNLGGIGAVLKLREAGNGPGYEIARAAAFYAAALGVGGLESTSAERLAQYYRVRESLIAAEKYGKSWEDYRRAVSRYNEELAKFERAQAASKKPQAKEPKESPPRSAPAEEDGGQTKQKPQEAEGAAGKQAPAPKRPKPPKRPPFDPAKEALLRVLDGSLPLLLEAHRPDDVRYALELKREFDIRLVLLGGTRAGELAAEIAEAGVPVIVEPALLLRHALEYAGHDEGTARRLRDAGVKVALSSAARNGRASAGLRLQACAAVRGGLDPEAALSAITLEAARALGLEDRIGSIEAGKDADLVLFDGPPLDARSRPVLVIAGGKVAVRAPERKVRRLVAEPPPERPDGEADLVLRNVTLVTRYGGRIRRFDGASLYLRGGRVSGVASASSPVPAGAVVLDLPGRWVLPGFIDAHSHIGLGGETDDVSAAILDGLEVLDAFDPWDPELRHFLGRGVTAAVLSPGRLNVAGGAAAVLKLVPDRVPLSVVERRAALKASLVPDFSRPRYPAAASGAAELFTRWLSGLGALPRLLLYAEFPVQVEVALAAVRAAQREGRRRLVVVEGVGTDAGFFARLPEECAAVLGPYTAEEPPRVLRAPAVLARRGIPFGFGTSGSRADPLTSAVTAAVLGEPWDEAEIIASLTSHPAELLGVDDRVGALEPGMDADFTVWRGDPLSLTAPLERVYIGGREVLRAEAAEPPAGSAKGGGRSAYPPAEDGVARKSIPQPVPPEAPGRADPAADVLIVARRVYPVSSPPLENAAILVRHGRIAAIGPSADIDPPAGSIRRVEVEGCVVPGFIDAGTTLGIRGPPADEFRETTPALRVLPAVDLGSGAMRRALLGGVTAAALFPGAANVIGGLGAVVKTAGSNLEEALLEGDAFVSICVTAEAHRGNASLRGARPYSYRFRLPTTRMGTVFLVRRAFSEALGLAGPEPPPAEALELGRLNPILEPLEREVLRRAVGGKPRVRIRADTREEILAALRIGDEFGVKIFIDGCREGLGALSELERARGVFLRTHETWGRELEYNENEGARLPAELARAGIPFAFMSDGGAETPQFRLRLAWFVRYGLEEAAVLRASTLGAAELLGVADRVGSIEVGKSADLVAFGGDPFSPQAPLLWVFSQGKFHPQAPAEPVRWTGAPEAEGDGSHSGGSVLSQPAASKGSAPALVSRNNESAPRSVQARSK